MTDQMPPPEFDLPVTGVGMSTRSLLVELGFEPVHAQWTDKQPGYQYDFGNFVLEASELTNLYLRPVIQFSGVQRDRRSLRMVDFELLTSLECFEQGVALIAHGIGRDFKPAIQTDWLEQGRQWEAYLPGRREQRLYQKRPKCFVEADWFKVAAKRLIALGTAANEDAVFSVSFKENVLRFDMGQDTLVMPAQGDPWQHQYNCRTSGLKHISKRTPKSGVWLSIWEARLNIGRLGLKIDENMGTNTSKFWIPAGSLTPGQALALSVPAASKPSREIHKDRLTQKLQALFDLLPKQEAKDLMTGSPEHSPDPSLIALNQPAIGR